MLIILLMFCLLAITFSLHLVASILFEDLEATAETLALLSHEDSLILVHLLVKGACGGLILSPMVVFIVFAKRHGHCRLSR